MKWSGLIVGMLLFAACSRGDGAPVVSASNDDLELAIRNKKIEPKFFLSAQANLQKGLPQDVIVILEYGSVADIAQKMRAAKKLKTDDGEIGRYKAASYASIKSNVMRSIPDGGATTLNDFDRLPLLFVRIHSEKALRKILALPNVRAVDENRKFTAFLDQGRALVRQTEIPLLSLPSGYRGRAVSVAVLDSGVDYTRKAFGYDGVNGCGEPGSACKVKLAMDFALPDDGDNRDESDEMKHHGTNVAGIVLGIAPEANILAFDVFDGYNGQNTAVVKAINWVIKSKQEGDPYNIVALNLSLGYGQYSAECLDGHDDLGQVLFSHARDNHIVPVVAAGNNGFKGQLAFPACAPDALSVGSVYGIYDASDPRPPLIYGTPVPVCTDLLTGPDQVVCASNNASFLKILAPGTFITAAEKKMTGTSQAAPHVAGAVAVLASAFPEMTPDEIEARLIDSGKIVQDYKATWIKHHPRLDLKKAVDFDDDNVGENEDPGAPLAFNDVLTTDWYARDSCNFSRYNISGNYAFANQGDGKFHGEKYVTRAEFIRGIVTLANVAATKGFLPGWVPDYVPPDDPFFSPSTSDPFTDVAPGDPFYTAVLIALHNGVLIDTDLFRPDDLLNRAEAAKILVETFNFVETGPAIAFTDVPVNVWYEDYAAITSSLGIFGGYKDNPALDDRTFRGANNINRAEAGAIIFRAFESVVKGQRSQSCN